MIDHNRLFATFMELCSIDSEPTRERSMADRLTEMLTALGFVVTEDDAGNKIGGSAGNLYARLEGTAAGEALLFSCHMDRVVPGVNVKPRIEGDYIVSDGTTVLGADDASGLAALLGARAAELVQRRARQDLQLVADDLVEHLLVQHLTDERQIALLNEQVARQSAAGQIASSAQAGQEVHGGLPQFDSSALTILTDPMNVPSAY